MSSVVIIDDQSVGRMVLEELVRSIDETLNVLSFDDPVEALEWVKHNPTDLILADYKMPRMDGVEFILWVRQIPACQDIPIIIVTCVDDRAVRYRALEDGATDFLSKPIDHHECRARCRNLILMHKQSRIIKDRALWLEKEVEKTTHELQTRERETLLRLAKAGEYRDDDTGQHVDRQAYISRIIAESLGLDKQLCESIEISAPMHDIGKIGVPDSILLKPDKLSPEEWEIMKNHTIIGNEILRDSPSSYLQMGAVIALYHHEKFDGSGYPHGLANEEIPLEARIVAVADVYDALMSERPYKHAWSRQESVKYLLDQRNKHFDAQVIDAFMSALERIKGVHETSFSMGRLNV
ncbi:MAG: response regulator [gamma proteobacterium symbiont of Bathyaustriella thionipta]|nr:response regulator [gamma proteobacterium symbiont of Bathyaustriella thionipta]